MKRQDASQQRPARPLTLVSHPLCPYVQRVAIVLAEKGVAFERLDVDLAHKPDWFLAVSPLGKTPVLLVDGEALFESAVICEFLDETITPRLHSADPLVRARHRGWIAFASVVLDRIAGFYNATDADGLRLQHDRLEGLSESWSGGSMSTDHGSRARPSRWSTPRSRRCSGISTRSIASAISPC